MDHFGKKQKRSSLVCPDIRDVAVQFDNLFIKFVKNKYLAKLTWPTKTGK
jgi:hypothetical protein